MVEMFLTEVTFLYPVVNQIRKKICFRDLPSLVQILLKGYSNLTTTQ